MTGPASASMPSADIARVLSHLGLLRSGILGACVTEAWWCVVPSQQICRRIVINEIGCGRVRGSPGAGQPHRDEAKFLNESLLSYCDSFATSMAPARPQSRSHRSVTS